MAKLFQLCKRLQLAWLRVVAVLLSARQVRKRCRLCPCFRVGTECRGDAAGDLALIRMMADGRLPVDKRRNYRNVGDALMRVIREEGFLSMWRGCSPTVARAMVLNAAQVRR